MPPASEGERPSYTLTTSYAPRSVQGLRNRFNLIISAMEKITSESDW